MVAECEHDKEGGGSVGAGLVGLFVKGLLEGKSIG